MTTPESRPSLGQLWGHAIDSLDFEAAEQVYSSLTVQLYRAKATAAFAEDNPALGAYFNELASQMEVEVQGSLSQKPATKRHFN